MGRKYYFFRDLLHHDNLLDGKSFHAAGYVEKVFVDFNSPSFSGKDLSVRYIDPFRGSIETAWRAFKDVELFEVDKLEYTGLMEIYDMFHGKSFDTWNCPLRTAPKFNDWLLDNFKKITEVYYEDIHNNETYSMPEIEWQYVMEFRTNI